MNFKDLQIIEPVLKALQQEGYTNPTPVQAKAIPFILQGKDLLGCAQTGTGKTGAFAIPVIQLLHKRNRDNNKIKALVLTPTRELAMQVAESFSVYGKYTKLKHTVIFGGVPQRSQTDALRKGVDILIATPGRLLDLMAQGYVDLRSVEAFILDEADRMLDMGFINDIKKILPKLPSEKQTLLFSATMPSAIASFAGGILKDAVKVEVNPVSSASEQIEQSVYYVDKRRKKDLLHHILQNNDISSALVFTRTKHGADKVVKGLLKSGIHSEAIHGNKSQNARQRALGNFKAGKTQILVATDIAARGIDIDDLPFVFNYDLPNQAETYVHRIGRTGRAGQTGSAISFCNSEERSYLKDIRKLLKGDIKEVKDHDFKESRQTSEAADVKRTESLPKPGSARSKNNWKNKRRAYKH